MIYLLHGNDFKKSRTKLREIISSQMKKNPDALYFRLQADSFKEESLEELLGGAGLFQSTYIVVCDALVTAKNSGEIVLSHLKEMKESNNIFILIEDVLTKEQSKKIEKVAEKVQEFTQKDNIIPKEKFNVFSLTDALGTRDKKRLWVLYQEALYSGSEPEEIRRLLFWQMKAMLAGTISSNAVDSGLNPFVYKKGQNFARNFSFKELCSKSFALIALYHDARRGEVEFDVALEKFILGI